jgi:hypothetical protein
MLSRFVFTLYQCYPLLYNQNLYSYTKRSVRNKLHKFKICFLTHTYITQHIFVNSVILLPSVAPIKQLRRYVCDGTVDDIPCWVLIVLYRSSVNVSLSSLLQCTLSHLNPRVESCRNQPFAILSPLYPKHCPVRNLRKREDAIGDWGKLHKEDLRDLYFSSTHHSFN